MASPRPEGRRRKTATRTSSLVTVDARQGPRVGTTTKVLSVFVAALVVAAAGLLLSLPYLAAPAGDSTAGDGLVITAHSSTFFPRGYYSQEVNFSFTHSGDAIVLGNVSFLYVTPSNLETRTVTESGGGNATTTVVVVTAEYQCGTSLGQQGFFFAHFNGRSTRTVRLDYCAVLNAALTQSYPRGSSHAWALLQVSRDTSPPVALYMAGQWDIVYHVALWIGK
jgi:hypothetical protein